MSSVEVKPKILLVSGSMGNRSVTRIALRHIEGLLQARGCATDFLDLAQAELSIFNPETTSTADYMPALKARIVAADVYVLGTPDYHGSMSGALKNFLDHFWKEFAGKLFATVVASHEKGLTATDQVRTVVRQCYAWCMPYAVTFSENEDIRDDRVHSEALIKRLEMLSRDLAAYGGVLAAQRHADLAGAEPGFLARHRK